MAVSLYETMGYESQESPCQAWLVAGRSDTGRPASGIWWREGT